jgi:hypothetical protein
MDTIRLFALCAALAATSLPTEAAEPRVWACWHSADGTPKEAVPMSFIEEDGVLRLRGAAFIEFPILQDNEVGLVAVLSHAEVGGATKHLGADVVVIDKITLDFRKGNVFADGAGADNVVRRGKCSPPR